MDSDHVVWVCDLNLSNNSVHRAILGHLAEQRKRKEEKFSKMSWCRAIGPMLVRVLKFHLSNFCYRIRSTHGRHWSALCQKQLSCTPLIFKGRISLIELTCGSTLMKHEKQQTLQSMNIPMTHFIENFTWSFVNVIFVGASLTSVTLIRTVPVKVSGGVPESMVSISRV